MIVYDFFHDDRVTAGFSERSGGVSPKPVNALNLSFTREPESRDNVLENHRIAAAQLGVPFESVTRMPQLHGDNILRVTRELRGCGVTRPFPPEAAGGFDGLITDEAGITLSTTHADCTPVLLWDPVKCAIAAVHSGWKGTCLKIAARAVERMSAEFGSAPADIKAIIGPAISKACFEVRADVLTEFRKAFADSDEAFALLTDGPCGDPRDPKWHVDMRGFVKQALIEAGIAEAHILDDALCTYMLEDRFFSHRRDGGRSGAMASFIYIKPDAAAAVSYAEDNGRGTAL